MRILAVLPLLLAVPAASVELVETSPPSVERVETSRSSVERVETSPPSSVERVETSRPSGERVETSRSSIERVETSPPSSVERVETSPPSSVERVETSPPSSGERVETSRSSVERVETSPPSSGERVETTPRSDLADSLEVLHDWDTHRARAWAEADVAGLRALYVRGSVAGRSDVRLLRAYEAHGIVVRRLVTQVFAVRVLHRDANEVRVSVYDRVAGGEVADGGRSEPLPSTAPVVRLIDFCEVRGTWRVANVTGTATGLAPGPHAGSPRCPGR